MDDESKFRVIARWSEPDHGFQQRNREYIMKVHFSKSRIVALSLLAAVGATFAPQVRAQSYYNPAGALAGGLIGGVIGNQAFSGHNRNDRAAATAGLAVVGAMIGGQAGSC